MKKYKKPGMLKKKTKNFRMFYKIIQDKAMMLKSMTLRDTSLTPSPPSLRLPRITSSKWTLGARAPPCPHQLDRTQSQRRTSSVWNGEMATPFNKQEDPEGSGKL